MGALVKLVFGLSALIALDGCGKRTCVDRSIVGINHCYYSYQLGCQSCLVTWSDGETAVKCQPIIGQIEEVCRAK